MTQLRALAIATSVDGCMAGPDQALDAPMGVGGQQLHRWAFATRTFHAMRGEPGGDTGVDDDFVAAGFTNIGATLMGRNMFGPVRGDWSSWGPEPWDGWWGPEPPYHHPVFVLTHHARPPLEMEGGTTFYFVTEGFDRGVQLAREAAGARDVRVGGGASTIRQCLHAGVLDELHLAVVPIAFGAGERIFRDAGDSTLLDGFDCAITASPAVAHYRFTRR